MGGAFQISRDIFNNPIWEDVTKFRIFFFIVGNAVFSDEGVRIGDIHLQRGQYLKSYRNLRDELQYIENRQVKKYSLSNIKKKIEQLVKENRLETEDTELGTLFTVVNYALYQGFDNYKNNNRERRENSVRTEREQRENNNKKDKNVNKDKKDKEKTIREIKDLRSSYSPELIQLVDTYWSVIKKTRKTNTISYNVILKTMQEWAKYNQVVIKYALKKHIEAYDDGERDEKYTLGIMRNTKPEEAADFLNKKVTPFKPRKGAPNYDEPPRNNGGDNGKPAHVRLYK